MKKITLSTIFLLWVNIVIGQTTNAILLYDNDVPDLPRAKEQIDKAAENEKQNKNAKMWYYRGLIYTDLASSDKAELKDLGKDGFKIAAESFAKVKEFDKPKGEYITKANERMYPLWANLINKGFQIKDENEKSAYEYYDLAQKLYPDSATSYEYGIDLAYKKENYEKLKEYYSKIVSVSKKPEWYHNWIWVVQNIDKNNEKALEIVQTGRKEYPSNGQLMEDEVNLYIVLNKIDEAQAKMEEAIKSDVKNPLLYFNLGTIYAKKGNEVKSIELYNKALALDPNSFETNFNLGAHYYNKAAEMINQTNKMSLQDYNKTGKKKEEEASIIMKQSLPYLEKAYSLNKTDNDIKKILKDAYVRLKMPEKVKTM